LPRRIDEAVLWAFVNEPGRVYELRIMIDFSGDNRGFAFVVYATKEEAKVACSGDGIE
jgi:RNA recognition motif-containing protein